jgi:hypothetical protein
MTRKQQFLCGALVIVLAAGGEFALWAAPPRTVPRSGVGTNVSMMGPVNWGRVRLSQGVVVAPLTESECTGLGGKVITAEVKDCSSGKGCVTAGSDGVIHGVCIDNKVN